MPVDFCNAGLKEVLSTTLTAPTSLARWQIFAISTTRNNGLLGLSTSTSLGFLPALPVMPVHRFDQQTTR